MNAQYAAHIIMAVKYREPPQSSIPFYENVVLIDAASDDEAWDKAEELGREDGKDDDPSFRWGDHPARLEFVGVRKLISCQPRGLSERIENGAELTYSQMSVRSEADLKKLVDGEPVEVVYEE
jgi:hypothetical protein